MASCSADSLSKRELTWEVSYKWNNCENAKIKQEGNKPIMSHHRIFKIKILH